MLCRLCNTVYLVSNEILSESAGLNRIGMKVLRLTFRFRSSTCLEVCKKRIQNSRFTYKDSILENPKYETGMITTQFKSTILLPVYIRVFTFVEIWMNLAVTVFLTINALNVCGINNTRFLLVSGWNLLQTLGVTSNKVKILSYYITVINLQCRLLPHCASRGSIYSLHKPEAWDEIQ
jgi:hypothetical protein